MRYGSGTGGVATLQFFSYRQGYRVCKLEPCVGVEPSTPVTLLDMRLNGVLCVDYYIGRLFPF